MTKETQLMADAKFYESYARYLPDEERYETWPEAVDRVMSMHRTFYADRMSPQLSELMDYSQQAYSSQLILGAQRALQFGGEQLLRNHAKLYNCTASYLDRPEVFSEIFWLMLCGCGVGFSVQKQHIAALPQIKARTGQAKTVVVDDSIEGWADAVNALMLSFFDVDSPFKGRKLYFDLTHIRPEGAEISGGFKAPGPEPLRKSLDKIERLIKDELRADQSRLRTIVAYDIVMHIADAVISGGVRRAATICLFSHDDIDMITAKTGDWFLTSPQRGRSNNSAVLLRNSTSYDEFASIMKSVQHSGEPGFVWTDDLDILFNPCVEIALYGYTPDGRSGFQMCNLSEINGGKSTSRDVFLQQCKAAAILGTLQAGYTDFKYLSDTTREIVEREALIGVGITGWMNNPDLLFDKDIQREGAETVKYWNKYTADLISINQAARTTCVKPAGNSSVLLGCASGIHGEHAPRYIRHVQMNKQTEVAKLFAATNPHMVETSVWSPLDYTIAFPVQPVEGSKYKSDLLGVRQLEYVKSAQENWVKYGTNDERCVRPFLQHNVSNTITVDDWTEVTDYIYDNRHELCGISLLAASGDKSYPQAPFTEVLTHQQIVDKYGELALFTSALIEAGLQAFNNDLWTACSTALGYGEALSDEHKDLLKRDWIRRFDKFASHFMDSTLTPEDYAKHQVLLDHAADLQSTMHQITVDLDSLQTAMELFDDTSDAYLVIAQEVNDLSVDYVEAAERLQYTQEDINATPVQKAINVSKERCSDCLKDVYNLHKWWRITNNTKDIDFITDLAPKQFIDINTTGAQACSGGACEVAF